MYFLSAKAKSGGSLYGRIVPYLLIMPTFAVVAVVIFYPIFEGLSTSLFDSNLLAAQFGKGKFVGFGNYITMFSKPAFWESLRITAIYALVSMGGAFLLGLVLALILNIRFRFRGIARSIMILPWAVPQVATCIIFVWMFSHQYGIINYILLKTHLIRSNLLWLVNTETALITVLTVTIWKQVPFAALMLLAGLGTIPDELYEAAAIDGAGKFQTFLHITMPGLKYVATTLTLLLTIWGFGKFVYIYLMTQGGPARSTETLVVGIYLKTFRFYKLGYASAFGTVLLGLSIILTIIYFRIARSALTGED